MLLLVRLFGGWGFGDGERFGGYGFLIVMGWWFSLLS